MRKTTYVLGVLAVLILIGWFARRDLYQMVVSEHSDKPFPEFELHLLSGEIIQSRDLKGKVVVLDFWATWCGACLNAFPEFQRLAHSHRSDPEVAFFAVNTGQGGDSIAKVRSFVASKGYEFPVAYDDNSRLSATVDIVYYPTVIILDQDGRQRFRHIGYASSLENYSELLRQEIERLRQPGECLPSEIINLYFEPPGIVAPTMASKETSFTCFLGWQDGLTFRCIKL